MRQVVSRQILADELIRGRGRVRHLGRAQGALGPHRTRADRGQWRVGLAQSGWQLGEESSKPIILEKLGVEEKSMENETYFHISLQNRSTVFLFALCS